MTLIMTAPQRCVNFPPRYNLVEPTAPGSRPFEVWAGASVGSELALVKVSWSGSRLEFLPENCTIIGLAGQSIETLCDAWDRLQHFVQSAQPDSLWYRRSQQSGPYVAPQAIRLEVMALLAVMVCKTVSSQTVAGWRLKNDERIPKPNAALSLPARRLQTRALEMAAYAVHSRLSEGGNAHG